MDKAIENNIRNLMDKEIVKMLEKPNDYTPEAIAVAQDEIEKRGGFQAIQESVMPEIEAEIKEIKEKKEKKDKQFSFVALFSMIAYAFFFLLLSALLQVIFDRYFSLTDEQPLRFIVAIVFTIILVSCFLLLGRVVRYMGGVFSVKPKNLN